MIKSETSSNVLQATTVDYTTISVRNLFYFFPVILLLGRWYLTGFFLVVLFIFLILEKLTFEKLEVKLSNTTAWGFTFIDRKSVV